MAGDTYINVAFANEGWNIGSREEDEGDGMIQRDAYIQSITPSELDIGSSQE